jgi:hypothetical protein
MLARNVLLALVPLVTAFGEPTFYRDVLPILQRHCQECHRGGEVAPMALQTYAQVRPWAKSIKSAVLSRKMPPWFADPHFGRFSNDVSLEAAEIATLTRWVDCGAHEGHAAEAPKPLKYTEGWRIPAPDAVFELPQPVPIPASGTIDYMYFAVPTGFTEDRWVDSIEVRPTNRAVVHHAIVYIQGPGGGAPGGEYLGGYAPGAVPQQWKQGQARLIPAGSNLIFQLHYTTNGKPATDRTRLGIVFAKHAPEQQVLAMQALNPYFVIPPGDGDFQVDATRTVREDSYLVGLRAHMHLRGKSFEFRVVYPTGRTEVLLRIPKYDFNWQPYYYLAAPLKLPRGTRIECTAKFDNSVNNPFNPNANAAVKWGEQSWDEMMIGWFDIAVPLRN